MIRGIRSRACATSCTACSQAFRGEFSLPSSLFAQRESRSVLKPHGVYIQISFGQPHFRKKNYFCRDEYGWTVTHTVFGARCGAFAGVFSRVCHFAGDGFGYFFYVMRKGGGSTSGNSAKTASATASTNDSASASGGEPRDSAADAKAPNSASTTG